MPKSKKCKKCLLPEGTFNVSLDPDGVCNYCSFFEQNKKLLTDYTNREMLLMDRIQKTKGKYPYDCIVGISGGKDSTFVLYTMVKKYKLKVLAVTYDNGFLSPYARKSISNIVKNLEVDHFYYVPDKKIQKEFYQISVQKLGDPCLACSMSGYFLAIKASTEKNVPFFVHGRSPFQMFRNFYPETQDLFLPMMQMNLQPYDLDKIVPLYQDIHQKMIGFIYQLANDKNQAERIIKEFFADPQLMTKDFLTEFVALFLYLPYNEKEIKKVITKEVGWSKPTKDKLLGHYDCKIHDASADMYKKIHGVDMLEPDVATMLRFGALTKTQAKKLLKKSTPTKSSTTKSYQHLCQTCQMCHKDFSNTLQRLNQNKTTKFGSR